VRQLCYVVPRLLGRYIEHCTVCTGQQKDKIPYCTVRRCMGGNDGKRERAESICGGGSGGGGGVLPSLEETNHQKQRINMVQQYLIK